MVGILAKRQNLVVFNRKLVCERARKTRQLAIFPLATPTVGWVLDRTPAGPKRQCRTRSAAESCAGGLPTENGAQGEALLLIDTKCLVGFLRY
jgi:hypothetical protein